MFGLRAFKLALPFFFYSLSNNASTVPVFLHFFFALHYYLVEAVLPSSGILWAVLKHRKGVLLFSAYAVRAGSSPEEMLLSCEISVSRGDHHGPMVCSYPVFLHSGLDC